MNALSTDTITSNLADSADAVRASLSDVASIDLSTVTDSMDSVVTSVVDTTSELVDLAGNVSVAGGRIVSRSVRRGGRLVRRHPRVSIAGIGIVVALIAMWSWRRRSEASVTVASDLKSVA